MAADSRLFNAVELGDLNSVEELLSSGNFDANTVLHLACYYGNLDVIRLLVSHGADFTVRGIHHDTPLMFLAKRSKYDCLVAIVGMFGCDPNAKDSKGRSLLRFACADGITDLVHVLVRDCKADLNDSTESPLMTAAKNNQYEVMKSLVRDYGCDPSAVGPMGRSLLHEACASGNIDLVHVLIQDCKADLNIRDHYNVVPLFVAAKGRQYRVVKLLVCEYGCDPNVKDSDGRTLLHLACVDGDIDLVHVLVRDCKADLNIRDLSDATPLIAAVKGNKGDIVIVLISKYKCDVNVRDLHGSSLLHLAGGIKVLKLLVEEFSLSITLPDNDGNTPLHLFSANGVVEYVRVLLFDFHAPVYVRNKAKKTPMNVGTSSEIQTLFTDYLSTHRVTEAEYKSLQSLADRRFSGSSFISRIFVVGHPGAGKTTLIEALKREGFFVSQVSEASIPLHTVGIIPSVYVSKSYGRVQFYDLAGDPEYYSSHAAILERLFQSNIGTNICILVLNLQEEDADIEKEYFYWMNFLGHTFGGLRESPSIVIIGSHSDTLPRQDLSRKNSFIQALFGDRECVHFSLNCRDPRSGNMKSLRQCIYEMAKKSQSYSLPYEASILLGLLEKDFNNVTACRVQTLASHIEDIGISLSQSLLYPILQQLQGIGCVLVGGKDVDSYIVLNIAQLANEVHRILLSRDTFISDGSLASFNIGLLPESILQEILPKYITKELLIQLQYCQEVSHIIESDHSVSSSISSNVPTSLDKSYLFFSALCSIDKKDISWHRLPDSSYTIGWLARCSDPHDFFPSRFLHILLLRIALRFTLVAPSYTHEGSGSDQHLKRQCKMWKSGVHWFIENGMECEVDVKEGREVVVFIQSEKNSKSCVTVFKSIVECVMKTKAEFCNFSKLDFFLLNALNSLSNDNLFALIDVEECLRYGSRRKFVLSIDGRRVMDRSELLYLRNTFWDSLFPIDTSSVLKYIENAGWEWLELGLELKLPFPSLQAIETNHFRDDARCWLEILGLWLSSLHSLPCWYSLVKALQNVGQSEYAANITKDKSEHIALQEKLLNSQYRYLTPDEEFLESFAGVVGSKWLHLASLLSIDRWSIEDMRRKGEGLTQREHALLVLHKWVSKGRATYDQLYQKLEVVQLFNYTTIE